MCPECQREYDDPADFRRQTMQRMIADFAELADEHDVTLVPATISQIAAAYRATVPPPS